ncbi:MAG: TRAP transporter large permease subunit [Ostreibacterium sp.]
MGPKAILEALALGSKNMIMTAVLLCAVGLIINVIVTAGIGNTFSLMIATWANGNLLIAIVLIGLASLVLGMGLPVTAAYIVLATLSAPLLAHMIASRYLLEVLIDSHIPTQAHALFLLVNPAAETLLSQPLSRMEALNLLQSLPPDLLNIIREKSLSSEQLTTALLSAHMIIFWLSQDSNVTPPVCLASFTAAAIAKSSPMKTGFYSWKIAKGLYIIPILFAYTPFLAGDWFESLRIFAFALFGIYAIAAALEGCMENSLNVWQRLIAFTAGILCLWSLLWLNIVGLTVVIFLLWKNIRANGSV